MNEAKAVLIIQDVKKTDKGKYMLRAKNAAGSGTADANLNVRHVPSIVDKPFVDPALFDKFELKKPDIGDKPEGPEQALQARLKFVEPLKDIALVEGTPVVFTCKLDAYPKAEIFWFKDEQPLMAADRYSAFYDMYTGMVVLRIKTAFNHDKGTYKCVAKNIAGVDQTTGQLAIQLTPNIDETPYVNPDAFRSLENVPLKPADQGEILRREPFLVVKDLKDQDCNEGETVSFVCEVRGYPEPEVSFYKF